MSAVDSMLLLTMSCLLVSCRPQLEMEGEVEVGGSKLKVVFDSGKAVSWVLSNFCQDEVTATGRSQHCSARSLILLFLAAGR
jgi:hypothetical protein